MNSIAKITKLLQTLRASYWFLPTTFVVLSALLAFGMLELDKHVETLPGFLSGFADTQVDGARALMTTISQSVFGVAGVMFSMTIVAVSFASGNFGPRLIGNFMRDRGNQVSLGILVATFAYCLLITRAIQSATPDDASTVIESFVPHLSIAVALAGTAVSVLTVIYFVHHIPETINVSNITESLGVSLINAIKARIDDLAEAEERPEVDWPERPADHAVTLTGCGYVLALGKSRLETIAEENGMLIDVHRNVGDFVIEDTPALRIWGPKPDEDLEDRMRDCFALGASRTEYQNMLFIVDELVEMSARALSPGVNDPFTAINCLNWLAAASVVAANYGEGLTESPPSRVRTSDVLLRHLLEQAFVTSRPYTSSDEMCDRHVMELFDRMHDEMQRPEHRRVLAEVREKIE